MSKVKYKNKSLLTFILQNKLAVFLSNFIFQGMRYMTKGEFIYKLSFTFLCVFFLFVLGFNFWLSLLLGHFINFCVNGQFFVLSRYLSSREAITKESLVQFVNIIERSYVKFGVIDVFVIGSFCRAEMRQSSDLDLRIYHKSGFCYSFLAYSYAFYLRFISVIYKFPMDVYCFSDYVFLKKIRADEHPSYFNGSKMHVDLYSNSEPIKVVMKRNLSTWV